MSILLPSKLPIAYPCHLVESFQLSGHSALLRPILPADAAGEKQLFKALSVENRRFRYHAARNELSDRLIEAMTRIDYAKHLGFVITVRTSGREVLIADCFYATDDLTKPAEFAVAVSDVWAGQGCGRRLIAALDRGASEFGIPALYGDVMFDNIRMLGLLSSLEFDPQPVDGNGALRMQRRVHHQAQCRDKP